MNYDVLRAEIVKPEYAGLDAQTVADRLNAQTESDPIGKRAPVSEIYLALAKLGRLSPIKKASENAMAAGHEVAYSTMALLTGPIEGINMYDSASIMLMNALKTEGLLSISDIDALQALSRKACSKAQLLGLEFVFKWDVERARAE